MVRQASRVVSLTAIVAASLAAPPAPAADLDPESRILWDQRDGDSQITIPAQNFEAAQDIYDCQGADDFVVPQGQTWIVKSIEAIGTHFDGIGPLRSMHVTIHRNTDQPPARPGEILSDSAEAPVEKIGCELCGSYLVKLQEGVELAPGRYWLALQGNMDFDDSGQWGWEAATAQRGKPGLWRNPGDGFGTECTDYRRQVRCVGDSGQASDYLFALHGKRL